MEWKNDLVVSTTTTTTTTRCRRRQDGSSRVGDFVKVMGGMHMNKVGQIESCTAKCYNIVVCPNGEMIQVLQRLTIPTQSQPMMMIPKKKKPTIGSYVRVIRGKYENCKGTILNQTPKQFHIHISSSKHPHTNHGSIIQVLQRLVEIIPTTTTTTKQPCPIQSWNHTNPYKPQPQKYTTILPQEIVSNETKHPPTLTMKKKKKKNSIPSIIVTRKKQPYPELYSSCQSHSSSTNRWQEEKETLEYFTTTSGSSRSHPDDTRTHRHSSTPSLQDFVSTEEELEFFYDSQSCTPSLLARTKQFIPKTENQPMNNASNHNPDSTNHYYTNNDTAPNYYYYPRNKILSNDYTKITSPRGVTDFPMYHQSTKDVTRTFWDDDDISSVTMMKTSNHHPSTTIPTKEPTHYRDPTIGVTQYCSNKEQVQFIKPLEQTLLYNHSREATIPIHKEYQSHLLPKNDTGDDDDDLSFSTATSTPVEEQKKPHYTCTSPPEFVTSNSYYEHSTSNIVSSDDTHLSHNLEREPTEGDCIEIIGGKHAGNYGKIYSSTPKFFKILCQDRMKVLVSKEFVVLCDTDNLQKEGLYANASHPNVTNSWRLTTDTNVGGEKFGLRRIENIRLSPSSEDKRNDVTGSTFLDHFVGNRKLMVDFILEKNAKIETKVMHGNNCYELISAKMVADPEESNNGWKKVLRLFYVQVTGDNLIHVNIAEKLSCIADYASLLPRKVNATLQLMQSPAYKFPKNRGFARFTLPAEHFCVIEEKGQEGCGFIDREYLRQLMMHGLGKTGSERLVSIQIRAWVYSIGVLKGVLCVKNILHGPPIQISPSMRKVGPSKLTDYNSNVNQAFLLVCQAGVNPTFSTNFYIGRLLDSRLPDPPSSFTPKKFKPMVPRLLKGMGVPSEIVDSYVANARLAKHLKHAWVVGLADPTEELPPGTVFVTGMNKTYTGIDLDTFFITRAPAMKSTDGRVVPVIREKPEFMSEQNWSFLNSLAFGSVIFANPLPGSPPLPNLISNGDLDGDLYFICWNHDIVSKVQSRPLEQVIAMMKTTKKPSKSKKVVRYTAEKDFFHTAQKLMTNLKEYQNLYSLISKLYFLSVEAADADEVNGLDNEDAICFADAYCMALEYEKHGELVYLPERLHAQVPRFLHTFLTCIN